MQKSIFWSIIWGTMALLLTACAQNSDSAYNSGNYQTIPVDSTDTTLPVGTRLSSLAGRPKTSWVVDTLRGVCQPDTMLLFVVYDGREYMTNIRWIDKSVECLTLRGNNLLKGGKLSELSRADFRAEATTVRNPLSTRSAYIAHADSAYNAKISEMKRIAENFFLSYGLTKYMAEPSASIWREIYAEADRQGVEAPNPFNRGRDIQFKEGSIEVRVTDANNGIIEVTAYCLDKVTRGMPGWAYWTVFMVCENGYYKLKQEPAGHRKFSE